MGNSSGTASGPPPSPSPSSPRPSSPPPPSRDPPPGEASPLLRLDSDADAIVERLIASGMACVRLDAAAEALHARCFAAASLGMSHCSRLASSQAPSPHALRPDADSAHATGVHAAGWGSAYNASREGFVFSDGACFGVPPDDPEAAARFERAMRDMHASAYAIALIVFAALERRLALEPGWFDRAFGPRLDLHSQWHVKRYRPETVSPHAVSLPGASALSPTSDEKPRHVLLPVHTDPSLISVVLHDAPGVADGAAGLQTLAAGGRGRWTEAPAHGHGVAVVFVGSVLDRITGGRFPAARHRVAVEDVEAMKRNPRTAATFFWRPAPEATLRAPPSPTFFQESSPAGTGAGTGPPKFKQMMFKTWSARVAKRYQSHAKPKPKPKPEPEPEPEPNLNANPNPGTHHPGSSPYYVRRRDARDARLALLGGPPLMGREKYLGGALGRDGKIYAIPGHARRVLRIDPSTGVADLVGPSFEGAFKWLRSVTCPVSGAIYGLPCHSDAVLKIVPSLVPGEDPEITLIGAGRCGTGPWKWHGGVLSPRDGKIYCIPQFAERVLRVDPRTDACELVGPRFPGRNKWYGGLLGLDGRIYGVPQCHRGVLRIDPGDAATCETFGDFGEGGWKWHGGVVGPGGEIYGVPAHANEVLKIVPGDVPRLSVIGSGLRTGRHRDDGKYKYLGAVLGRDGNVYCVPSDADRVLMIECATGEVREVGASLEGEAIVQNKWQNGFLGPDGVIWAIPLKAETVLTVTPAKAPGGEPVVETVGGPFGGLNKWEGGVMSACGKMYCMPLNHKAVLEIDPCGAGGGPRGGTNETFGTAETLGMASTAGMNHD